MFSFAEWVNEVGDKIFRGGLFLDSFLFVFDDYAIIGNFDDFFAWNGKLRVDKSFDQWAFDDKLLNHEAIIGDSKIRDFAKFGAFFGFYFKVNGGKIEVDDFADFDDIVFFDELLDGVYYHAVFGIFAN